MDDIRLAQILRALASAMYREASIESAETMQDLFESAGDSMMELAEALEERFDNQ